MASKADTFIFTTLGKSRDLVVGFPLPVYYGSTLSKQTKPLKHGNCHKATNQIHGIIYLTLSATGGKHSKTLPITVFSCRDIPGVSVPFFPEVG